MICTTYKMFFGTLADPAKLEIITLLNREPKNVSQISTMLKREQSCVSHNLRKLKELGFVTVQQRGKERVYYLDKKVIQPLLRLIQGHVDTYYAHYCRCQGIRFRERCNNKSKKYIKKKKTWEK